MGAACPRNLRQAILMSRNNLTQGLGLRKCDANSRFVSNGGNRLFLPGGRAPREATLFVQTALAGTLRKIAAHGADAFYAGPVAADIVATLRTAGGLQTEEDLAKGRTVAEFVEPIREPISAKNVEGVLGRRGAS